MKTIAMALLLLLWLHIIVDKSSLSIKHAENLREFKGQSLRKSVRLQHRIKAHVSHLGQVKDASGFPAFTDRCPNNHLKE